MNSRFQLQIQTLLRLHSSICAKFNSSISRKILGSTITTHQLSFSSLTNNHKPANPQSTSIDEEALKIQTLLKTHFHESTESIEQHLEKCNPSLSEELVLNVLKRHRSDWKSAYAFFRWLRGAKNSSEYSPETSVYNEILDILGRMRRFEELYQVLDEMRRRKELMNERTYGVVVSRLAAAHKVDEAIQLFDEMEGDLGAFQTLLLALCRYKHVEAAELLFRERKSEFDIDIKTWNIILNGWCVLRSLPDAKRFWRDILASEYKPDRFTYGIFINSLCKCGKASRSMELLRKMWEEGCKPDVAICNTVIDGLCFKKRIPEALGIFSEMSEKGCPPNAATYNSLIKHLCKIQRMEVVYELVNEMGKKGGSCLPNALTYGCLLKAAKNAEEVDSILERMEESGCKMEGDTYNLVLRLFVKWGDEERMKWIWEEMERSGMGHDRRSYTIIVHGLCDGGKMGVALEYFAEMVRKGIEPEPRTKVLVDEMRCKLNEVERVGDGERGLRNPSNSRGR